MHAEEILLRHGYAGWVTLQDYVLRDYFLSSYRIGGLTGLRFIAVPDR